MINAENIVEFAAVDLLRDTAAGQIWVTVFLHRQMSIVYGQEYVTSGGASWSPLPAFRERWPRNEQYRPIG